MQAANIWADRVQLEWYSHSVEMDEDWVWVK